MRVAVIGLGSMGMGAALNLAKAPGLDAAGCDPREAARAEFAAAGGTAVARAADLPAGTGNLQCTVQITEHCVIYRVCSVIYRAPCNLQGTV